MSEQTRGSRPSPSIHLALSTLVRTQISFMGGRRELHDFGMRDLSFFLKHKSAKLNEMNFTLSCKYVLDEGKQRFIQLCLN